MTSADSNATGGDAVARLPVQYYWCVFSDDSNARVCSLSSDPVPASEGAVPLPATDPRVQYLLNPPEGRCVQRLTLSSLDELNSLADLYDAGIPKPLYRGQGDYRWQLKTGLERNAPPYVKEKTGLEVYEYRVLTEAQRRLHHFITQLPDEDDLLSWRALLRHHGVPTRLLDVTRSLFIACYFALRNAKPDVDAAVWIFKRTAIDRAFEKWGRGANDTWLRKSPFTVAQYGEPIYWPLPKKRLARRPPITIETLRDPELPWLDFAATLEAAMLGYVEKAGVAIAEPFWLTRRMDVQQGAFLIPFNVRHDFESNLFSFLELGTDDAEERPVPTDREERLRLWAFSKVIKVRVPGALHRALRDRLDAMNIRELTLFPDAEGAMAHITSMVPDERK